MGTRWAQPPEMVHWPKPGFMFPEVKPAVPYQTKLCCILRGGRVKTSLSPRANAEVRRAKRKEEGSSCRSRRETVMRTGAACGQTKGRKRMTSCMITPQLHAMSPHPGGCWMWTYYSRDRGTMNYRNRASSTYLTFYRVSASCDRLLCIHWS